MYTMYWFSHKKFVLMDLLFPDSGRFPLLPDIQISILYVPICISVYYFDFSGQKIHLSNMTSKKKCLWDENNLKTAFQKILTKKISLREASHISSRYSIARTLFDSSKMYKIWSRNYFAV